MKVRDYIITYSGEKFSPLNPDPDSINIADIAHALSRIGRANGHFVEFYAVGQHCLDCAHEAIARGYGPRQALACLLHDASEAYMSDITSPVKKHLRQYVQVEDRLLDMIYEKYIPGGITPREQRIVKEIDNTMLYYEFIHFTGDKLAEEEPTLVSEPCFSFSNFYSIEEQYLYFFDLLSKQAAEEPPLEKWQTVGIVRSKDQWLAAIMEDGGCRWIAEKHLADICTAYPEADSILIDFPVGLPENADDEKSRPEIQDRKYSYETGIITPPCRQAVYAETDQKARELNVEILGKTISPRQMEMRPLIREVDTFILGRNPWKNVLRQSHPKLLGEAARVLRQTYTDEIGFGKDYRDREAALCLAMIGQMECRKECEVFPKRPDNDARGIAMQLVVPKGKNQK